MFIINKLFRFLWIVAFILILSCSGNEQVAGDLSREFLSKIMGGHFSEAANVFHYPEKLTEPERTAETEKMTKTLNIVTQVLGLPRESRIVTKIPANHSFYIYTSDEHYWEWFPVIGTAAFHVNFINAGSGYIILSFAEVNDDVVLKKVQFCLPMKNSDSKAIIMNISKSVLSALHSPIQIDENMNNLSI